MSDTNPFDLLDPPEPISQVDTQAASAGGLAPPQTTSTSHDSPEDSPPPPEPAPARKRPRGGQTIWTREIADEICERLIGGEALMHICKDEHMPSESTVLDWADRDREGFAAEYERARRLQAERFADEILLIADDTSGDTITRESANGNEYEVANHEWIARSKIKIETRKWLMGKRDRRKYGERVEVDQTVTHQLADLSDTELYAQYVAAQVRAGLPVPPVPPGMVVDMAAAVGMIDGPARSILIEASALPAGGGSDHGD